MAYGDEDLSSPAETGVKGKLKYNLEGLIPLILIIIIAFFLAARIGVISSSTPIVGPIVDFLPGISDEPASLLVIGTPSTYTMNAVNNSKNLVNPVVIKSAESLEHSPEAYLANFDIVLLDQSQESGKYISKPLGDAIQKYVQSGGKFIIVGNSGIRRPGAPDVLGWKATFGEVVPVECSFQGITNTPSCVESAVVPVNGKIFPGATGFKHEIMQGFTEGVPAGQPITFQVYNVTTTGNEIAYIQDYRTNAFYPAIVEAKTLVGKSIYFNYDPGLTPGILQETFEYLK